MAKTLFKGIQQVVMSTFTGKTAEEKKGYLWFVREPQGENTGLGDDKFHIYFGTRCYGSFWEGEHEALAASLAAVKTAIGLGEDFSFAWGGATTVVAAFNKVKEWYDGVGTQITDALTSYLVKNVDANDKVLNVADGILSSTISLKYENNRISLVGKNDAEIAGFDASSFIKDSVLEDVKVETKEDGEKYIIFTWKTEGEETKTDEIKVSDFAKLYNAGTALELAEDGVTFNVKVAENGNFLSVNDNNELIVDDMTVDKTVLKEAITIEGGPLATDAVKGAFEGGVIPVGTDIQSVLKALLCVEIYPEPEANTPTYTASISAPTISAKIGSTTISNNALVEVGQVISFAAVTAKEVSTTPTNPEVTGFTHGYCATKDGVVNTATTITGSWTISQAADTVYELKPSKTNFTGDVPASATSATYSSCQVAACELTAVQGDNTYSVAETAPKYVGTSTAIDSMFVVSNLGGRDDNEKSPAIDAIESKEVTASAKTGSFKVVGTYPMYTNGAVGALTSDKKPSGDNINAPVSGDGTKLALMNVGSLTIKFASQGLAPYQLYIPQPLGWKISKALYTNPLTGKVEADGTEYFKKNGTTTRTIQNVSVTYDVWEWAATQGADFVTFTVAKQ